MLTVTLLNGLGYGLLLFMLSAGFTLVFSLLGVLNFAHAAFYMLGAYFGYQLGGWLGFWPALVAAPAGVALLAWGIERFGLRAVHRHGHVAELLFTFGLAFLIEEAVHLAWGRAPVDYRVPAELAGTLFSVGGSAYPAYRVFVMAVSAAMLLALWWLMARTRTGLFIRAARTHPETLEGLGFNVARLRSQVFAAGAGLAGLAGVVGGALFVTEPGMAGAIGSIIFVVVVLGGLGSLGGALVASLAIGLIQTALVASDSAAPWAPVVPYLLMVLVLLWRPGGLAGRHEPRELY